MSAWGRLFGKRQPSSTPPTPSAGPASPFPPQPDPAVYENRRIRVFVSSTFRDMAEERDALMTHAWPELRRFCRERQVELTEVDLRWGISEEQSTRKETLKLCLDEIHACRPFFVGLLGERYGWVPGEEAFTADLLEEQEWLRGLKGKSVTELEIVHGVLKNPEMAGRAFFYFRDPAYAQGRGADFLPEDAIAAAKQSALKSEIRSKAAVAKVPVRENYPDPRALASMVLADLQAAVEAQFPKGSAPDPLTREARDHEAFAEIRRRTYIGRPDYYAALDRHAASGSSPSPPGGEGGGEVGLQDAPLVLLGDSGSGKSSLLANWVVHWRESHPKDMIFQHYIGSTADSAEHWRLMTRLIGEIKRRTDDPEEVPRSHDDLVRDFPVWLAKARIRAERTGVRFIIILDALNQLEDRDHARLLGWLPSHPFQGPLRLIVSTLPGDTLTAVEARGWATLRVEPLTVEERRRMIAEYLKRFSKKLDAAQLDRLAAAPAAANPLYLKVLLDELRVTGTHDRLDERLAEYLAAPDIPSLLRLVLSRYERDYERDRPGLVGEALGLIWAARRGLTELELLHLLRPAALPQLPLATWAPLRAALDESLVDRGGILNFAHDFLRAAVEAVFVPDENARAEYRLRLADDFEGQPVTARSCDELPWLLWQAKARDRLRACLLDIDRFLLIQERDKEELMRFWVWLGEERTMGPLYRHAFDSWDAKPNHVDARVAYAASGTGTFLLDAALLGEAEQFLRRVLAINEKLFGPDNLNVASALNNLGQLLQHSDRMADAEPLMRRALTIVEKNTGPVHPNIATCINNLAQLLQASNRTAEAEPLVRRALAVDEECFGPYHPSVARDLSNLTLLLHSTDRLAEAECCIRRSLAIDEENVGPNHPNVARDLNNLVLVLHAGNRLEEAEPVMRRALAIDEKAYGVCHPNVAICLKNLAHLLKATNRFNEAESFLRRALAIDEKSYGLRHPQVAIDLNTLGQLLHVTNRMTEAEPLIRRALDISEKGSVPDHPRTAAFLLTLAHLLQSTDRVAEAELLMRRAQWIYERSRMDNHPYMAVALSHLAGVLKATGRLGDAEPFMRRALEIDENNFGPTHLATLRQAFNLGILLRDRGDHEGAVPIYRRIIETHSKLANSGSLASDHVSIAAACHNNLAFHTYSPAKNWEKAESHYRKSIELFRRIGNAIEAANVELNLLAMFHQSGRIIDVVRARALTKTLEDAGDKRAEKGHRLLEELSE